MQSGNAGTKRRADILVRSYVRKAFGLRKRLRLPERLTHCCGQECPHAVETLALACSAPLRLCVEFPPLRFQPRPFVAHWDWQRW